MKWWSKIKKPLPTPETDPEALKRAHEHVAEQQRVTDERWDDVRNIARALRVRSDRNHLAEAILADRRRKGHHA